MIRLRCFHKKILPLVALTVATLGLFAQPLAAQERTPRPDGPGGSGGSGGSGRSGDESSYKVRTPGPGWEFRTAGPLLGGLGPRGFLGVHLIEMTPELRRHMGAPEDAGVLIGKVEPGSPAEQADLQVGDVLTVIDGNAVATPFDVTLRISPKKDGEPVNLTVWRDGSALDFTATLERKEIAGQLRTVEPRVHVLPRGELRFQGPDGKVVELKDLPDVQWFDKEQMAEYFKSPEWTVALEEMHRDREPLLQRIDELEKRLAEMETLLKKLEKK